MSGRLTHAVLVIATAASLVVSPVYAQNPQATPPPAQSDQTPGVLPPPPQYQPPTATQGPPPAPSRDLGVAKSTDYSKSELLVSKYYCALYANESGEAGAY